MALFVFLFGWNWYTFAAAALALVCVAIALKKIPIGTDVHGLVHNHELATAIMDVRTEPTAPRFAPQWQKALVAGLGGAHVGLSAASRFRHALVLVLVMIGASTTSRVTVDRVATTVKASEVEAPHWKSEVNSRGILEALAIADVPRPPKVFTLIVPVSLHAVQISDSKMTVKGSALTSKKSIRPQKVAGSAKRSRRLAATGAGS